MFGCLLLDLPICERVLPISLVCGTKYVPGHGGFFTIEYQTDALTDTLYVRTCKSADKYDGNGTVLVPT